MSKIVETAEEQISVFTEQDQSSEAIFIEEENVKSILESLLFAAVRPMSFDSIRGIFSGTNIKAPALKKALNQLILEFAGFERGIVLEEVAGGYQIRTKPENLQFIRRMIKGRPFKLSGPSLETLAIVAYKQPCIKSEVDQIRGVDSGHLVRLLMEKGLVQFAGKSELPGKPMMYKTTKKFLEIFGLRSLRELPSLTEIEELIPEGIGAPEQEKKTLDQLTTDLSLRYGDLDHEAEHEYSKITQTLSGVNTTTDFFEQEKLRQKQQREKDKADDIRERLMLGHEVAPRDRNWLERYEQSLVKPEAINIITEEIVNMEPQTEANQTGLEELEMGKPKKGDEDTDKDFDDDEFDDDDDFDDEEFDDDDDEFDDDDESAEHEEH